MAALTSSCRFCCRHSCSGQLIWGGAGTSGHFELGSMIGAMLATAYLGLMLAITYALGRRSLMPVVAAHAAIDMIIEPWLMLFAVSGGFQHLAH